MPKNKGKGTCGSKNKDQTSPTEYADIGLQEAKIAVAARTKMTMKSESWYSKRTDRSMRR